MRALACVCECVYVYELEYAQVYVIPLIHCLYIAECVGIMTVLAEWWLWFVCQDLSDCFVSDLFYHIRMYMYAYWPVLVGLYIYAMTILNL